MKTKRTLFAAAITLALASTSVAGQGVKMTDEQLDQVTAAGAKSLVIMSNPGNRIDGRNLNMADGNHAMCMNCGELFTAPHQGKTGGVIMVQNRKFNVENGTSPITRCVGAGIAGFC